MQTSGNESGNAADLFWKESKTAGHLNELATQLSARGYQARLVAPRGARPLLQVRNPDVPLLAEDIYAESGRYWYAFAEPIASVSEPAEAARKIAHVLRAAGPPMSAP